MPRPLTSLQVAEILRRAAEGESPYAIAKSIGCAYSTVVRYVGCRRGVFGPRPRPPQRCDVCLAPATEVRVISFALLRATERGNRGAGAIHLCAACWRDTAAKRQRTKRRAA